MSSAIPFARWFDAVVTDLLRQLRWSFLPPVMIYFAYGCSTITLVTGTFFVKDYLDFSAAYIAGLAFWAGLPWALKMPLGHLVDIIWRWKWVLIWLGAGLIAASVTIMALVITRTAMMQAIMPIPAWYITSYLLAPCGLVLQDAVADAMSVEAVPARDTDGTPLPEARTRAMHTTMQTLGRFALIAGTVVVALINISVFSGVETMDDTQKETLYSRIYTLALIVPVLSVSGVILAGLQRRVAARRLARQGLGRAEIAARLAPPVEVTRLNPWYFIGGGAFVALTLTVGLGDVPYGQEIIFAGSMAIVIVLMRQLVAVLEPAQARMLVGTALILFFFRATPLPGAGQQWFEIDVLGFDQRFLSVLSLIVSVMALFGMVVLRPMMATRSITWIVVMLTIAAGLLSLPNLGLYYGIHNWTGPATGGVVDARFIAIIDTAVESPLGQIAMIPMLAWIARNAPGHLKATFFAVMASFANLALSASALLTRYLNQIFEVAREVRDPATEAVISAADYTQLGWLLIAVTLITVSVPLLTVLLVQRSPLHTTE